MSQWSAPLKTVGLTLGLACSGDEPPPTASQPSVNTATPDIDEAETPRVEPERSDEPRETPSACKTSDDCSWIADEQACTISTENRTFLLEFGGDYCGCNAQTGQCHHTRFEPVPCETSADCDFSRDPVLHPVPSTSPRVQPFRPCVDGEVDSTCAPQNEGKYCRVDAWAC